MAILQIAIKKVRGQTLDVDTDKIPEGLYQYALEIGLKDILARGMSKFKKEDFKTAAEFDANAIKVAEEQLELLYSGKTRRVGAKAGGTTKAGPEMTEALRLAKLSVKEQLKAAGYKISHIAASDITKAAKAVIEADRETWIRAAAESLAKSTVSPTKGVDLAALVKPDPKKEKAAAERKSKAKAEAKAPVAAKGKPKAKPQAHA